MPRALGANDVLESREGLPEDVTIEKEERRERLVLCRSRDAAVGRQMREKGVDSLSPISAGCRLPWKSTKRRTHAA
jgi:hypothetical protein